ncbi:UDP-N-acetylglucosamine transferase subunit ALG13 [Chironomus tepperi]|uniref:UDP-N-acetylglucosamine transferase subunit ALG13 n=1 Tax=Chironomus tepperi TaxID=113505 RepID=UPI00391F15D3
MEFKRIFVTVGTTEFNNLIEKLSSKEVYEVLKCRLKCKELIIQRGNGKEIDFSHFKEINVQQFDLKTSIERDITEADLVISHAGAGTCIDVLGKKKPLLVVVNDTLMNNHQIELAEQLHKDGYLVYCFLSNLVETLETFDASSLKEYEKGNLNQFIEYLDDFMGFI